MKVKEFDALTGMDLCNGAVLEEIREALKELEVLKQAQPKDSADAQKLVCPECGLTEKDGVHVLCPKCC